MAGLPDDPRAAALPQRESWLAHFAGRPGLGLAEIIALPDTASQPSPHRVLPF